ncbi:hypothetical protein E4U43_000185 [Claviceps pusilla]|uniref:tripeptidyl-peptidase II n=1 Tax=Claviceps pusilla TaxID=123648 RepID=A0A9P7SXW2_9HYPO|nr:hypothetical protein E4U43_000185 [Claviceps pusilla]
MVRVFLLLLFLRLFACAFTQSHVAYEPHLSSASASCSPRNAVHGERLIRLIFSLAIPRGVEDSAVTILQDLSDPESSKFAQHWTTRQINRLFASDPQQVREVTRWLQESSVAIKKWSLDVDHLLLDITSRNAQKLLHTTLNECVCGHQPYICSDTYHLPRHISGHIDHVTAQLHPSDTETHSPSSQRRKRKRIATAENINRAARLVAKRPSRKVDCFKYTTPDCLRLLYGIPSPSASEKAHPNNSIGIYAPDWSTWLGRDLDLFFGDFQPNLMSRRPVLLPINGGYRDETLENSNFFIEPNLDFGYSMSLVEPLHVTDIQIGDKYLRGNLNTMLAGLDKHYCHTALDPAIDPVYPDVQNPGGYNASDCGNRRSPLVISISWAQPEAELPARYLRRQCIEFLKLGLQGVTVLAASGDTGPASTEGTCIDMTSDSLNVTMGRFSPNFPASCPWVTAVGGTQLLKANSTNASATASAGASTKDQTRQPGAPFRDFLPETALETAFMWQRHDDMVASSGGGFSRVFATPAYQARSVQSYLDDSRYQGHLAKLSAAGYFSPAGRGYPDLSASASGYLVYVMGRLHQVYGTSASTPVVASMVARINDARLKVGKGSVGFINPVLYRHAGAFVRDVCGGHSSGCGVSKAFPAARGWDAVTGLGTVNYTRLLEVYLGLP